MRYLIVIFTALLFFSSCKKTKEVASSTSPQGKELSSRQQAEFTYMYINASKEKMLGNYETAAAMYKECTKINPKEPAPYYEMANIFSMVGRTDMALPVVQRAVDLDGDNFWYRLLYADCLQKSSNIPEAIKQYQILVDKNPSNYELYFELANLQLYQTDYKGAIDTYNKLEQKVGITEEVSLQKQKAYVRMNDVDKAAAELKKLIKAYPDETRYLGVLADLYLTNEREDEALEILDEILKKDPNDPYTHLSLADYYKAKKENEKSFEHLSIAFESPDLEVDAKVQILLSYYQITEYYPELKEQAFSLSKKLIEVHPENAKSYTVYADFLYREEKLEEARENYRKALELEKDKFPIWGQVLLLDSELNDFKSLVEESDKAMELFPLQPLPYLMSGIGNNQTKNYEKAVESLEAGKDLVLDNPIMASEFYSNMGEAYHNLKMHEKSDAAFDKCLKTNSKNAFVLNNYAYYLSVRGEKLEKALEMSAKSIELEPNLATFLDTYGWVLYKLKRYDESIEWLLKAEQNGGATSGEVLEHIGDAYYQNGNTSKALEYWKKAKAAGGASDLIDKKINDKKLYE